jgi:polyisoprenyl-teichoic acid--peptidoglycan teichoic acid transferase
LAETLGISTKHWIRFEMTGFQSVVDAIGGVTIFLDCPFYEPIFNLTTGSWEYFTLPAGEVYLDGEAAYWFVRLRLRESDIGRARRQRQFLWAVRDQMLQTNLLVRLPELWTAFRTSFSTDLNLLQLIEFARLGIALDPSNVRASGLTLKELQSHTTAQGASVLVVGDPAKVRAVVEGIWDAVPLADTNRQDVEKCSGLPVGAPNIATETGRSGAAPITAAAPAEAGSPENDLLLATEEGEASLNAVNDLPAEAAPDDGGATGESLDILRNQEGAIAEPDSPPQANEGG